MQRFYLFRLSDDSRWQAIELGRFGSVIEAHASMQTYPPNRVGGALVVTDLEGETLYVAYGLVPLDIEERIAKAIEETREERRKIADSIAF